MLPHSIRGLRGDRHIRRNDVLQRQFRRSWVGELRPKLLLHGQRRDSRLRGRVDTITVFVELGRVLREWNLSRRGRR